MVLSYNAPPFDLLMQTQQETWDSVNVEGVKTVYYHGGVPESEMLHCSVTYSNPRSSWKRVALQCTDAYYYMGAKFKKSLDCVFDDRMELDDFDIIFRTNSSSYVNKKKLIEFAEKLPKEKLYAGWEIKGNEGFNIVSGAGIFMSRDVAEILRDEIDPNFEKEEDYYIGQILSQHNIPIIDDKSREDVNLFVGGYSKEKYHFRFKGNHGNRQVDAENMVRVHQYLNT